MVGHPLKRREINVARRPASSRDLGRQVADSTETPKMQCYAHRRVDLIMCCIAGCDGGTDLGVCMQGTQLLTKQCAMAANRAQRVLLMTLHQIFTIIYGKITFGVEAVFAASQTLVHHW